MPHTYAAKLDDTDHVVQVIVGTAAWAEERLGGRWVDSPTKVGVAWLWDDVCGLVPPSPFPSWTLVDCVWTAPVPEPVGPGPWCWDEDAGEWVVCADPED